VGREKQRREPIKPKESLILGHLGYVTIRILKGEGKKKKTVGKRGVNREKIQVRNGGPRAVGRDTIAETKNAATT